VAFTGVRLRLNIDTGSAGTAFVELRDEAAARRLWEWSAELVGRGRTHDGSDAAPDVGR